MPKYVYKCGECEEHFTMVHGMTERQEDCILCNASECLTRVPQMPHIKTSNPTIKKGQQVGSKVKEAIEENNRILKEQKERLSNQVYNDDN